MLTNILFEVETLSPSALLKNPSQNSSGTICCEFHDAWLPFWRKGGLLRHFQSFHCWSNTAEMQPICSEQLGWLRAGLALLILLNTQRRGAQVQGQALSCWKETLTAKGRTQYLNAQAVRKGSSVLKELVLGYLISIGLFVPLISA